MRLDALLKFVALDGDCARCRIDFPRVPDEALELFTVPELLRLRFLVGAQEWIEPVEVLDYQLSSSSTKAAHSHVACTVRAPRQHWAFARERRSPAPLSVAVEIERLQPNLFTAEPHLEESAAFINQRASRARHSRPSVGGGSGSPKGKRL